MKIKGLGDVPSAFSQKAPVPDHPTVRTGPDRAFRARFSCPDEQARTVSVLLVDERCSLGAPSGAPVPPAVQSLGGARQGALSVSTVRLARGARAD